MEYKFNSDEIGEAIVLYAVREGLVKATELVNWRVTTEDKTIVAYVTQNSKATP